MRIVLLTTDNREHYKDYAAPRPYFGSAPEALLQGFEHLPAAEVHVVSCTRQPVAAPQKIGPNIFFHSLLVPRIGWMRTGYQGCIRAVRQQIKTLNPAIVHGQGTELDCAISAVFSGLPNVITIHGNMRLIAAVTGARIFSFPWLAARLEGFTIPRADGVVCLSRYTEQAMLPLARRTWVVSNAVDSSFFEIAADPSAAQPPRILCVAHVDARKNQNAFIRALDPLAKQRALQVVFLGKVNKERAYDAEFLSLVAARPWCVHEGFASRDQLKSHLRQTTLLALPSIEDNCPMVVLEAMAAGVPVVAANVGGLPDLIESGQTGVLCDPLDPLSIQNSIDKVLLDPAAASGMARRAKQRALEKFHPKVIASRHLDLYQEVLNSRSFRIESARCR